MTKKKQIKLSDHFEYQTLLRFTLPSMIMMIFTSIYSIVEGLFVSNFVGKTGFAAISLIMPALYILGTFGYMFGLAELLAHPISAIFVGYDSQLQAMTVHGFRVYAISYLFMGMAIFSSSFFTALNNGLVSALISFLRTMIFELGAVLLLPIIWGVNGIWGSVVVAEFMATVVGITFMVRLKKKYRY